MHAIRGAEPPLKPLHIRIWTVRTGNMCAQPQFPANLAVPETMRLNPVRATAALKPAREVPYYVGPAGAHPRRGLKTQVCESGRIVYQVVGSGGPTCCGAA